MIHIIKDARFIILVVMIPCFSSQLLVGNIYGPNNEADRAIFLMNLAGVLNSI